MKRTPARFHLAAILTLLSLLGNNPLLSVLHLKFIFLIFLFCFVLERASATPVISEFMASNDTTLADENGDYPDWIEIHNPDTVAVDLAGWHLTDDATMPTKWTFPTTSLPAGEYLIVFASDKDRAVSGNELHTNFKLSSGGGYLALVQDDGSTVNSEFNPYPAQQTDVSYGLPEDTEEVVTVIDEEATLKHHVPTGPVAGWNTHLFDDGAWPLATSGVGYERDANNIYDPYFSSDIESITYDVNGSIYLRIPFQIVDPSKVTSLTLLTKHDDGFIAFIDGEEIACDNITGTPVWNSLSTVSQDANLSTFQAWGVSTPLPPLFTGNNVLAIQLLNESKISSDFLMLPKLEITRTVSVAGGVYTYFVQATPGSVNNTLAGEQSVPVTISEASGVKSSAISVTLTTANPLAEIRYNLDGTIPAETSTLYTGPIALSDPSRLRAKAYETGKVGGPVNSADYAFLDSSMLTYLADVPVIVMDNFSAGNYPKKGYSGDGSNLQQVARQANVMSFFDTATNSQPFSQSPSTESRAGCRGRGSSSINFSKQSLSVELWDGDDNDNSQSLFGMPAEADWALTPPNISYDKSLLHNPVTFEFAKLLGSLAPDSRVVVVFQNKDGGKVTLTDLEGVYVLAEKIERNRMGMDFKKMDATGTSGGWMLNKDRMDPIPFGLPANTPQPQFHAAGPNQILQIGDDIDSMSSQSVDDIPTNYNSYYNFGSPRGFDILTAQRNTIQDYIRGIDTLLWSGAYADPVTGYSAWLDVDSWARYYAVQNFAKNTDAIFLSTFLYRESATAKLKMGPQWDYDRAYTRMGSATSSPLWRSDRDWYGRMFTDVDFKQVHQDLWQEARRTTLTDAALDQIVDNAAAGLRADQVLESGYTFRAWQTKVTEMKTWMTDRANYLDSQYEPLPSVLPESNLFVSSILVNMSPTAGGTIYYTTDGTDPRASGGGISRSAFAYSIPFNVTQRTRIIARTRDGANWSGPIERNYYQQSELPQLVVSEINYHPADPTLAEEAEGHDNSDDFEYLEVQNIGTGVADLSTLAIAGGLTFDIANASSTSLAPGARALLVRDQIAFEYRHGSGLPVIGQYQGALNNIGDQIIIRDQLLDLDLQNFSYEDGGLWPGCADGLGYSLILKQPDTNPDHSIPENWRCSSHPTGNPGTSDAVPPLAVNPTDDDDGDGLSALMEHFLGTSDQDTTQGHDRYSIGSITLPSDGFSYPTFEVHYNIGADDVAASSLWSHDLQSWSSLPDDLVLESHTLNGDGTATMVWRATQTYALYSQFFRLMITQQ